MQAARACADEGDGAVDAVVRERRECRFAVGTRLGEDSEREGARSIDGNPRCAGPDEAFAPEQAARLRVVTAAGEDEVEFATGHCLQQHARYADGQLDMQAGVAQAERVEPLHDA